MKVLIVEDEERISSRIKTILERESFEVKVFNNVEDVIRDNLASSFDLIVLDLMLPGVSGDTLVDSLRKSKSTIPILVLSSLRESNKKVRLLDKGADDYLSKPFDERELIARINALYRRHLSTAFKEMEEHNGISFHWKQNKITRNDVESLLTNKESSLLEFLLRNKGKVVRNDDILLKVWDRKPGYHSNLLQTTIRRLRKKIDDDFDHKLIRNVHGVGYMFVLPDFDN